MTKITSQDCSIIAWPGIIALQLDASRHLLIRLGGTPLPPLTIPTRHRPGIIRFAELPEEAYTHLLAAIARAPECRDSKQLASWLADETPEISGPAREEIISSIASMYRVQKSSGVPPEEFAQDVWQALIEKEPDLDKQLDRYSFKERIAAIPKLETLDTAHSRVMEIKREVERNFCKVKVITDLRPAFRSDASIPPTEMAIIHNLQIGYHDGMGKHHEFYVSLDGIELAELKLAVIEAQLKAEVLANMLSSANVTLHK